MKGLITWSPYPLQTCIDPFILWSYLSSFRFARQPRAPSLCLGSCCFPSYPVFSWLNFFFSILAKGTMFPKKASLTTPSLSPRLWVNTLPCSHIASYPLLLKHSIELWLPITNCTPFPIMPHWRVMSKLLYSLATQWVPGPDLSLQIRWTNKEMEAFILFIYLLWWY